MVQTVRGGEGHILERDNTMRRRQTLRVGHADEPGSRGGSERQQMILLFSAFPFQAGRVEREIARRAAPPRGLRSGGEIRETIKPLRANPFDDDVARIALQATGERTRTQR